VKSRHVRLIGLVLAVFMGSGAAALEAGEGGSGPDLPGRDSSRASSTDRGGAAHSAVIPDTGRRELDPTAFALAAAAATQDTMRFSIDLGAGTDVTNELYYEDAFLDTTFLGRRLVSTPESRFAALLHASLVGTRGLRATSYQLQNDLSLGDRVQRNVLSFAMRSALGPDWKLYVRPHVEYRHDRTFDRDLEEGRAAFTSRVRRTLGDGLTSADVGFGADWVRTEGDGTAFLLDRNTGSISVALDHLDLQGDEWRVGYRGVRRVFPDSSERDHDEHQWDVRGRWMAADGHSLGLETMGSRRRTHHAVSVSRDNFWNEDAAVEGTVRIDDAWSLTGRVEAEAYQYDREDSTIFFDYEVLRFRLGGRLERPGRWSVTAGPRIESLFTRLAPAERYTEVAGQVEIELWSGGSWWSVTPRGGWRDYVEPAPVQAATPEAHSSYGFVELDAIVDQALTRRLKLRGIGTGRLESHTDEAQDARSLYLSMELRWAL
jgi:hypothetical protein